MLAQELKRSESNNVNSGKTKCVEYWGVLGKLCLTPLKYLKSHEDFGDLHKILTTPYIVAILLRAC